MQTYTTLQNAQPIAPFLNINDLSLPLNPHEQFEWTMDSKNVALGYGVGADTIRKHKSDHADELLTGKHFITVSNPHGGAAITHWTKKGIVRLGFFIKSPQAKQFRDLAEDLVLERLAQPALPFDINNQVQTLEYMIGIAKNLEQTKAQLEQTTQVVHALEERAAYDAPKLQVYDAIVAAKGNCSIAEAAQEFGTGSHKFYAQLRADKILIGDGNKYDPRYNTPYQKYVDSGYFVVCERYIPALQKSQPTTFVTPKGRIWLAHRYAAKSLN